MSDGAISQDEIEALLAGVAIDGLDNSGHVSGPSSIKIDSNTLQTFADEVKDPFLSKIVETTGGNFTISEVKASSSERDKLLAILPEDVVVCYADFETPVKGDHLYLLSTEFAQKIVNLVLKEEKADLDEMSLSCIGEFLNHLIDVEKTELAKNPVFENLTCIQPETVRNPKAMIRMPQRNFALITYSINLNDQKFNLWEAISSDVAESISGTLGGGVQPEPIEVLSDVKTPSDAQNQMNQQIPNMQMNQNPQGMNQMQGQMMGMQNPQMQQMNMGMQMPMGMQMGGMNQQNFMGQNMGGNYSAPNVQNIQYPNFQNANVVSEQGNIGLIMDVNMEMTVELGRTKKQVKEILAMGEGTILELDKLAGEPVDILVNHKPIAKGEVVVIDENFGVRVTEILSPLERVSELR